MPHSIRIDDAKEHIFILRNLAYAAKEYARQHVLTVEPGIALSDHATYFPWITEIVGDRLLDVAMIARIAYDVGRDECEEYGPNKWDEEAMKECVKDQLSISDIRPSIREVCNKIIHAKSIRMVRVSCDGGKTEEWNGRVQISGDKGKVSWLCEFFLPSLCDGIEHFLELASENIDWFDLYEE
jgi:hypothetical protein